MTEIAPGWYKDPAEPTTQRWWDGEQWIGDPLPIGATPPAGPPKVKGARKQARTATAPTTTAGATSTGRSGSGRSTTAEAGAPQNVGTTPVPPAPAPVAPAPPPPTYPPPAYPPPPTYPPPGFGSGGAPAGAPPDGPAGPLPGWSPSGPGWPPSGPVPGWPPGRPLPAWAVRPHGYPVAPLGLRLLARLIDIAALILLNAVANGYLIYRLWGEVQPYVSAAIDAQRTGATPPTLPSRANTLILLIELILVLLWFVYEVPATASRGQTLGKRIMGIKVMRLEDTQPLGMGRAWRRWNPLALPVLLWTCLLVGFVLQLIDSLSPTFGGPLRLALHDRSAGTVVVRVAGGSPGPDQLPPAPRTTGGSP